MQRYQNVIIDTAGTGIASVTVSVYLQGTTTLATLYAGNGVTPLGNPFLSDADGSFNFYAADGRYDINLAKTGYSFGSDLYDIQLFDLVVSPLAFAGTVTAAVIGTPSVTITTGGAIAFGSVIITSGTGTPEGVKTAPISSLFLRTDGGIDTAVYYKQTGAGNTGWVPIQLFSNKIKSGSFTLGAAATKVVNDANVGAASTVYIMPSNAAAATLMSGAKALYHSANNGGVSFTVATADGNNAAGTETFNYLLFV
jgi:hypothetical protein